MKDITNTFQFEGVTFHSGGSEAHIQMDESNKNSFHHISLYENGIDSDSWFPSHEMPNNPQMALAATVKALEQFTKGKNVLITCGAGHNRSWHVLAFVRYILTGEITEDDGKGIVDFATAQQKYLITWAVFPDRMRQVIENLRFKWLKYKSGEWTFGNNMMPLFNSVAHEDYDEIFK